MNIRFPIILSLLTLLATTGALLLAVFGIHWGSLARPEVLNLSAAFVLQSLLSIVFILWPAMRIGRTLHPAQISVDFFTILISASPAIILSWWLSEYNFKTASGTLALLWVMPACAGAAILLGVIDRKAGLIVQTLLQLWYLGGLLFLYLHAEFMPAFSDSFSTYLPAGAMHSPLALTSAFQPVILFSILAVILIATSLIIRRRILRKNKAASA